MTHQSQFQIFPNSPQSRSLNIHGRRPSRRRPNTPVMSPVAEETKPQTQTEAVIFRIIEETNTIMSPSDTHIPRAKSPARTPTSLDAVKVLEGGQQTVGEQGSVWAQPVPLNGNIAVRPRTSSLYRPPPAHSSNRPQTASPYEPKLQVSTIPAWPVPPKAALSPTSSHSGGTQLPSPISETHMKSIFPPYDPRFPLNKQPNYYPQRRSNDLQRQMSCRNCAASSLQSLHSARHSFADMWASIEELAQLWDLANGEGSRGSMGPINLRLCRVDSLTYTLGNRSVPLYSLKTNPRNDIEIHRKHPSKLNTKAPVVTLSLGEIGQCNDENIWIALFPKLAEIFAREEVQDLARRNRLSPPQAFQAESDAVRKAEGQESCVLRWNASENRYDIFHGALLPPSPRSSNRNAPGLLHLTLSTPPDVPYPRPTVRITYPGLESTPLMTLDLNTSTLTLSPDTIQSTVPSLYAIDALIATILTVAVLDDRSSIALRAMEIYEPKAEDFPNPYRLGTPCSSVAHSRNNSYGQSSSFTRNSTDMFRNPYTTPIQSHIIPGVNLDLESHQELPEEPVQKPRTPSILRPASRSRFSQMTRRNRLSFHSVDLRSSWRWIKRTFSMTPEPTETINLTALPKRSSTRTRKEQRHSVTTQVQAVEVEHAAPPEESTPASRRARLAARFVTWVFSLVASMFTGMAKCFRGSS